MNAIDTYVSDIFLRMHWDIGDRLAGDSRLLGVPVTTEYPKDLSVGVSMVQRMQNMLGVIRGDMTNPNGKCGLIIFVEASETLGSDARFSSLTFDLHTRVSCVESRIYNSGTNGYAPDGTGLHAHELAVLAAQSLQNLNVHLYKLRVGGFASGNSAWLPTDLREAHDDLDLISWGIDIHGIVGVGTPDKHPNTPTFTYLGNGQYSIQVAGEEYPYSNNRQAFYTTDGSYPSPATATLYTSPIQTTVPTVIRTCYNDSVSDLLESDVFQVYTTYTQ